VNESAKFRDKILFYNGVIDRQYLCFQCCWTLRFRHQRKFFSTENRIQLQRWIRREIPQVRPKFRESARESVLPQPYSRDVDQQKSRLVKEWKYFQQVLCDRRIDQAVAATSSCFLRTTLSTQTLEMLCHSHGRTFDTVFVPILWTVLVFWVTSLNNYTLQYFCRIMSKSQDTVCWCYVIAYNAAQWRYWTEHIKPCCYNVYSVIRTVNN